MKRRSSPTEETIRLCSDEFNRQAMKLSRSAECLSVYSDSSLRLKLPRGTMLQCCFDMLALCWILPYVSYNTIEAETRAQFYNHAIANPDAQYSELLRKISINRQWNINDIVRMMVDTIGTEAYFGSLIQYLESKRVRTFKYVRQWNHEYSPPRRVKKSQRKRGYTDKGHLPDQRRVSHARLIHQEEAKEAPRREKPRFLDFIRPRRWGRK